MVGLTRRYGARAVLEDLHLHLGGGERLALLGRSGSGKSTLLRVIAGHEGPDAGDVRLGGRSVLGLPPERRGIGMVFQSPLLFPGLTVRQNLEFGPRAAGVPAPERRRQVQELLARTRLEDVAELRPHQLSGGQAQRAALARSLAARPRALLLDEPLSALDAPLRAELRGWLAELLGHGLAGRGGTTALLVTHDREEAFAVGQRLGVLHGGRLAQVGAASELYLRPVSAEVALLVGEGTLLSGQQSGHTVHTALGPLPAQEPREGPVTALLRPEHLRPAAGPPGAHIHATAERLVYAGDHLRAHLRAGGEALLARLPPGGGVLPGDRVALTVPPLWTFSGSG